MPPLRLDLQTIRGDWVRIPDPSTCWIHLQFRRFSGCPICHTHLRSFVRRHGELAGAGIREIVFFHSSSAELKTYEADVPFDLIADPERIYYRQFKVGRSPSALLHAGIIGAALRGAKVVLKGDVRRLWIPKAENGRLGLPADFLVDRAGVIVASKFGRHANDQWEVDELLELVHRGGAQSSPSAGWLPELTSLPPNLPQRSG